MKTLVNCLLIYFVLSISILDRICDCQNMYVSGVRNEMDDDELASPCVASIWTDSISITKLEV